MNRFLILFVSLIFFGSYSAVAEDTWILKPALTYAEVDGKKINLDLYLPLKADAPHLVIWIHGGGWSGGSRKSCKIKWLTEHGYAVASISYRLTDVAIFPAQIHDCKAAVRWLRAKADEYGYSKDRIAVAGSSAGGHLSALLGTSGGVESLEGDLGAHLDQSSRVQAVIDYYGATDFVLRSKTQAHRANKEGSVVYRLLGGGADQKVELAKQASAAWHVTEDDPPLLVIHGDEDKTVLLDQSQKINEVYSKAGLPVEFHVLKGEGHGGDAFYTGKNRQVAVDFLERNLRR